MPYEYLREIATADVAFAAQGATLEEVFSSSVDAMMNVMVEELSTIEPAQTVEVEVEHGELDLLLFSFLNELIFYKDARRLLLRVSSLNINRREGLFSLKALLCGEEIDLGKHHMNVDEKG